MTRNLTLPFDDGPPAGPAGGDPPLRDGAARAAAVDPTRNIVLEASAGTGKTRVLVDRYLNLLRAGVEPANILAITFTRKAAAEMRQRIVRQLRDGAALSPADAARWRGLRDHLGEIAISTIDAFCLSLLREFPLEADLDPAFEVADETEIPRLVEASLDRAIRICRHLATEDEDIALVFAQLGEDRLRLGLAALLDRRLVAGGALSRFLAAGPRDLTLARACELGMGRLRDAIGSVPGGVDRFLASGPIGHPRFTLLARDIRALCGPRAGDAAWDPSRVRGMADRIQAHFLTDGKAPRKAMPKAFREHHHPSRADRRHHRQSLVAAAGVVADAIRAFRRDLNVVLSRGVWRMFSVAVEQYRRTLDAHGVLDFAELVNRASALLGQMDEFAQSRFRLEARYHHILVDEFQDTSRAQWGLVSQLVRTWGEGFGVAHEAPLVPSIFVVGDRKQSIYGFRDAEVTVLDDAARAIGALRPDSDPLQSISHSFRSVPVLLAFANDLFADVTKAPDRDDGFRYDDRDAFPVDEDGSAAAAGAGEALGIVAAADPRACAAAVAHEIVRLAGGAVVRDRQTGIHRPIRPADIAVLFRSRDSHREFEQALEARGVPTYVYKGLGFFDADETKDVVALLRYLADPGSDLRAAALLRSRLVRLSDAGLRRLAPGIARALTGDDARALAPLDEEDRGVLLRLRPCLQAWLPLVDRVPPSEVLDRILGETAYAFELRGPRLAQAGENLKKIRALVRRIQNRGYLTMGRLAAHLDRLSAGDESNAVVDAIDAVSLMTVHAAKGLEFPVVFVVNLARGTGGAPAPIRVASRAAAAEAVAIGDFRSEADEDEKRREQEETKRLLYVAVTRARDRLYLSSALDDDGTLRSRQGSLAEVAPDSMLALFPRAAGARDGDAIDWAGTSGRRHWFRVCAAADDQRNAGARPFARDGTEPGTRPGGDDFEPIQDSGQAVRVAATALAAPASTIPPGRMDPGSAARQAAIGVLVHRLFQAVPHVVTPDAVAAVTARALALVRDTPQERLTGGDRPGPEDPGPDEAARGSAESLARDAARLFIGMRGQPDVQAVLGAGQCLFEVPFSLRLDQSPAMGSDPGDGPAGPGGLVVRGVMDCLALADSGPVVVIDFKTGAPKPADLAQLDLYLVAARRLFPGREVEGRLVYPDRTVRRSGNDRDGTAP